jgi:hypothetical protein
MKKFILAAFLITAPLGGCAALQAGAGTISQVAPDTVAKAKKALTAAHDLHRGVADFLTVAATTNLCHATCASKAKLWLDQSETALVDADKLLALGDAPGVEIKIALATSLIGQIQSQIGHN